MRALVVTAPGVAAVTDIESPRPGAGELLVRVERVGLCGTDTELFTGVMPYIAAKRTTYPLQLGHEWTGTVTETGDGVDEGWLGSRITGDTMVGCGHCELCLRGTHWVCADRKEMGILDGMAGALAEEVVIPVGSAYLIPAEMPIATAALVEPGANALRAVEATQSHAGNSILILGSGTVGLLAAQFSIAAGLEVHLVGNRQSSLDLAKSLGVPHTLTWEELQTTSKKFDAVIDATSLPNAPQIALQLIKPGGRIALIGVAGSPSYIDTRDAVFADVTMVGILSASPCLEKTIEAYAAGLFDPRAVIAEVVSLDDVPDRLRGLRGANSTPGPKIHVDPRLAADAAKPTIS